MSSLRKMVNEYKDDLQEGITWVIFWKEGRSWESSHVYIVVNGGEEIIDNMYPAIIDREMFDSVQAILKTYQHGKNSIEVTYLLRNKLKCGYCGQSIIGECGTAKNGNENRLLNAYIKEQKDNERAINNIVANMERGIVAKATSNRLCELETRQEELERLILIEQSKQTVKITETQIRTFYEQALKYEPQMLINYIVIEIIMYDDRIDIIYNSPIIESPDDENRQGFVFNMKSVRLDKRLILIHFIVV